MPRKGVPYGGAICSLKERIAELFDLVGEKLHSINGVQGDGQGNVQIVSGDPAVVIANDAAQNKIKIALDNSKLPSAAVSSVNGETGAVVLDAGNILTRGNANVQTDIDAGKAGLQNCIANINTEREARENADAALQANINQVQAGIPGAAAAAVATDPTVAQLAVDVPNKVDKIASGSTKRAYTHTGAVQDDTPVVNGTDANSIGLRDANGRMYAADPASGATDRSLTTANWISQTGDNAPNNLVHRIGAETVSGVKTFTNGYWGRPSDWHITNVLGMAIGDIAIFGKLKSQGRGKYLFFRFVEGSNTAICNGLIGIENSNNGLIPYWFERKSFGLNNPLTIDSIVVCKNASDEYFLGWRKPAVFGSLVGRIEISMTYGKEDIYDTSRFEWITPENIGRGDGYTITEAQE